MKMCVGLSVGCFFLMFYVFYVMLCYVMFLCVLFMDLESDNKDDDVKM